MEQPQPSSEGASELQTKPIAELLAALEQRLPKDPEIIQALATLKRAAQANEMPQTFGRDRLHDIATTTEPLLTEDHHPNDTEQSELAAEGEKWAQQIRAHGAGAFNGLADTSWEVNGVTVGSLLPSYAQTRIDAQGKRLTDGQAEFGTFVSEELTKMPPSSLVTLQTMSDSRYGPLHHIVDKMAKETANGYAVVCLEPRRSRNKVVDQRYEFRYIIPQGANLDRGGRGGYASMYLVLPTDIGRQYQQRLETKPALIEATFQALYKGLAQHIQRPTTDKIAFITLPEHCTGSDRMHLMKRQVLGLDVPIGNT